ncbi:MAG: type I-C CRISPR-associated endonuclease Cas1c [Candidatus Firestonebacteria bacterium]
MRKYLNTIYITTPGSYLHKEGETVVVEKQDKTKVQFPLLAVSSIVCFGNTIITPHLMGYCSEKSVAITYLNDNGKFLASVRGEVCGNVLLRREQYRLADNSGYCTKIASEILMAKINNSRTVLSRVVRDHSDKINADKVGRAINELSISIKRLKNKMSEAEIRGIEGDAAKTYFSVFNEAIISQKDEFVFNGRNRRPPLDNVNCLLSFVYTLIMHDCRSALETVGLDPYVGFLHKDRPGRPGLALDLMEEFRSFLGDRVALNLINREQVKGNGFEKMENGAVLMTDKTRKELIIEYQKRKQEEITHLYLNEKMPIGLIFFYQALLFARCIRGEIDGYPAYVWR